MNDASQKKSKSSDAEIDNPEIAAVELSSAMEITGFYRDGPLDKGMPENFLTAQIKFRKVLTYIEKLAA